MCAVGRSELTLKADSAAVCTTVDSRVRTGERPRHNCVRTGEKPRHNCVRTGEKPPRRPVTASDTGCSSSGWLCRRFSRAENKAVTGELSDIIVGSRLTAGLCQRTGACCLARSLVSCLAVCG